MKLINAESLAIAEIVLWLDDEWYFAWNNRKTSFGLCDYYKKEIQLSRFLTESQPIHEVLDTIKHEIAHALSGSGNGHNHIWKRNCRIVGCKPKRASKGIKVSMVDRGYKWAMVDEMGMMVKGYHRKPNRNTFLNIHNMYLPGRRAATLGNMKIVPMSHIL